MRVSGKFIILFLLGSFMSGCKPVINKFAFHPDNANVIPVTNLPSDVQELTIRTEDNVKITSLFLPVHASDKIVIYFHGNAGNIYHRIPTLQRLKQLGINVIGVSYRGYGKSEGKPTEEGIYLDGKAILQHVVEQMGFSKENIIIFGRSIGTTVAINVAQYKNLRGLVLVTPLTSGREQAQSGGLSSISFLAGNSFNNIKKIINIKSPLLVIHGSNDHIIPYAMGKKIYDKATVKKKLIRIEGANHNNLNGKFSKEYWLPIIRFIKNV